jgi:hypothetical protein
MICLYAMPKGASERRKEWLIAKLETHGDALRLKHQLMQQGWHTFRITSFGGAFA